MRLGVFDSGVGGQSVADELTLAFPEIKIILRQDPAHLPYGNKSPDELYRFVLPILSEMMGDGCRTIVIACNTVSTTILPQLQLALPELTLLGVEPMVEQAAALSNSRVVAVCATPATLQSQAYSSLKAQFAAELHIIEPDCSDWASLVEQGSLETNRIKQELQPAIAAGADVIVLGCTHYHWIEDEIRQISGPGCHILQPVPSLIRRLTDLLPLA